MNTGRKSQIEIQFNWIFVLIAGFVIFLFIISIIINQKNRSDDVLNIEISKQLLTSIKNKQQLSNTYNEINIPEQELLFTCDNDNGLFDFKFATGQRQPLPVEIIFGPSKLNSNKLLLWTQDFALPYVVTRFAYVTSKNVMYIVFYNGDDTNSKNFAAQLYSDMPANITKIDIKDVGRVQEIINDYKNYKIICIGCPNNPYINNPNYMEIIPSPVTNDIYSYGTIKFKSGAAGTSKYIGKALLFGAVFSSNQEYYECQADRAFAQFNIKKDLNRKRFFILQGILDQPCQDITHSVVSILDNTNSGLSNAEHLFIRQNELYLVNKDLEFKSCPVIY